MEMQIHALFIDAIPVLATPDRDPRAQLEDFLDEAESASHEVILLEHPVLDASALVELEDADAFESQEIVHLEYRRLSVADLLELR